MTDMFLQEHNVSSQHTRFFAACCFYCTNKENACLSGMKMITDFLCIIISNVNTSKQELSGSRIKLNVCTTSVTEGEVGA